MSFGTKEVTRNGPDVFGVVLMFARLDTSRISIWQIASGNTAFASLSVNLTVVGLTATDCVISVIFARWLEAVSGSR